MIRNKQKPAAETEADSRIFELQADICQTLANPKRLQIVGLLKHGDAKAVARERKRSGQPADAGAGNNNATRGRQGRRLPPVAQAGTSCKAHSAGRAAPGASVGS